MKPIKSNKIPNRVFIVDYCPEDLSYEGFKTIDQSTRITYNPTNRTHLDIIKPRIEITVEGVYETFHLWTD